ncbi:hypothetical protein CR513_09837, partial [Mucuna pruriens]
YVREKKETKGYERKPISKLTKKPSNTKIASNDSLPLPPIFARENYHLWATKMRISLKAQSLWDIVEKGENPAIVQIRNHNDEMVKEGKELAIIHAALHDDVFIKILTLKSAKEAWDKLKEEFQRSEKKKKECKC